MAILNMNYSVSGSGGGNIGEPLNLTVTTSGLDATITWEDNEIGTIPPTTFQKSELVRKIGSAPTSPSDGDLVVTETVKDTYKVSGYVDEGLTDGETYYYRVFSYSDLGGISYCDAVSVTISNSWQPGANTVLYMKLAGDYNDYSGQTGMTVTSSDITYGTLSSGLEYGIFNGSSSYAVVTNKLTNTNYTAMAWMNLTTTLNNQTAYVLLTNGNNHNMQPLSLTMNNETDNKQIFKSMYWVGYPSYCPPIGTVPDDLVIASNTWYHIASVRDNTTNYLYINGVLAYSGSITTELRTENWSIGCQKQSNNNRFTGYISNIIVEDGAWSAQDISDYYNATKGDYGIS